MLTTDLAGTAGTSAGDPQHPEGTHGQTGGAVSMSKALELAKQLEGIVADLRVDTTAQAVRERELTDLIVGLLTGKVWAFDAARADPEIGPAYREAINDMAKEVDDGDLPF